MCGANAELLRFTCPKTGFHLSQTLEFCLKKLTIRLHSKFVIKIYDHFPLIYLRIEVINNGLLLNGSFRL